jgi:hypothetical protein
MVQLAQWRTSRGLEDAIRVLVNEDFDPDTAEHTDPPVQTVLTFGESIGTLVKNNLLSRELVHDWIWVAGLWARVGPAARRARDELGEPRLYENLEALAAGAPA